MDGLMAPTLSIDVKDRNEVPPPPEEHRVALFLKEDQKDGVGKIQSGFGPDKDFDDGDSDASSSIGAPDSDEDDGGSSRSDGADGEVESKLNRGLSSLDSLEDSLPTKRGLSNHFSGKSKSFSNLAEACSAKDLEKGENPFNKRRRVLMAAKWSRKSSFYACHNPKSMPMLALKEDEEEEALDPQSSPPANQEEEEEETVMNFHQRRLKNLKSFSCISLSEMENHHLHQF